MKTTSSGTTGANTLEVRVTEAAKLLALIHAASSTTDDDLGMDPEVILDAIAWAASEAHVRIDPVRRLAPGSVANWTPTEHNHDDSPEGGAR